MPTKKVFWTDPYLIELKTKVTNVDNDLITIGETIFRKPIAQRRQSFSRIL